MIWVSFVFLIWHRVATTSPSTSGTESVSWISRHHSYVWLLVDHGCDPRWRLPIERRNCAMRRRMSWDCRRHRGHTRRSLGNSFLLAVPNYVDWRICMGIVDAELFIVGAGEEKIESKSSRLQRVEFLSPF